MNTRYIFIVTLVATITCLVISSVVPMSTTATNNLSFLGAMCLLGAIISFFTALAAGYKIDVGKAIETDEDKADEGE